MKGMQNREWCCCGVYVNTATDKAIRVKVCVCVNARVEVTTFGTVDFITVQTR